MNRIFCCLLAFAAIDVCIVRVGSAQEDKKETKTEESKDNKKEGINPRLGGDGIVERLMTFDKNKDGNLTKDELPERLQNLIEKGDLNKDGALDKDEIRKRAATPGIIGNGDGRGEARRGDGPVNLERVIDDLAVRGEKRQRARAAVQSHQNEVRKFLEKSQAELLEKMKGILTDDEFNEFKAAVERQRPGR